jgi:predicted dehydrogenase
MPATFSKEGCQPFEVDGSCSFAPLPAVIFKIFYRYSSYHGRTFPLRLNIFQLLQSDIFHRQWWWPKTKRPSAPADDPTSPRLGTYLLSEPIAPHSFCFARFPFPKQKSFSLKIHCFFWAAHTASSDNVSPNLCRYKRSVTAQGFNQFSEDIKDLSDYDAVSVTLRGARGESVTITSSRHSAQGYDQRLEAFGSQGMLRVENITDTVVLHYTPDVVEARGPYQNIFLQRYSDSCRLWLSEFIKKIHGRDFTSPTFEDGRQSLLIAEEAAESAANGSTVNLS